MWSPAPLHPNSPHFPSTSSPTGPLFPTTLISPDVSSALPENYTIRPLQRSDYKAGMLDVLRVLTTVGDIGEKAWNERYDWLARRGDEYYILVVCNAEKKVVGTGAVVVERKLYVCRRFPPPMGWGNLWLTGHASCETTASTTSVSSGTSKTSQSPKTSKGRS